MSNVNIRHRSATITKHNNVHIIRDVSPSSGVSTTIRQSHKKLHTGVWGRIVAIVSLFTLISLFILRIERYEETVASSDNYVRVGRMKSSSVRATSSTTQSFVTVIMPSVVNSNARPRRLANIATTWGPNANAIYVVHDFNEYSNGADIDKDSNTYPQNLVVPSHITVENGVERLEHVIRTIHKDVNPDFCFFVNDHTFVLPNNLCKFLKEHDSSKNLYAGHALKGQKETAFNSGAAGYVLSRSTMEKLIREWDDPNSKCAMANSSKWLQGNPGLLTAQCFGQVLHIPLIDTRDKKDLSHKFHAYGLVRTISGNIDDWYINKHKTLDDIFGVDNTYHHAPQSGSKCCSSDSISFHYVEAGESLAFWKVLQTVNESPSMTDTELQQLIEKVWPRDKEGFGGYSARLPSSQQLEVWSDILQVVRNIASGVSPSSC